MQNNNLQNTAHKKLKYKPGLYQVLRVVSRSCSTIDTPKTPSFELLIFIAMNLGVFAYLCIFIRVHHVVYFRYGRIPRVNPQNPPVFELPEDDQTPF